MFSLHFRLLCSMEGSSNKDSAPMAQAALRTHALFLGNLNNELPKLQIAAMILQLTHQCTGLTLELTDIKIRYSLPSNCFTATLKLPTPDVQQNALTHIGRCEQVPNGLVKLGRTLRVDVFQRPTRRKGSSFDNPDEDFVFLKGQHLGAETRTLEFKEMSNLSLQYLRKIVAKYVCAFLNSSGGALMLGVDDRGISLFISLFISVSFPFLQCRMDMRVSNRHPDTLDPSDLKPQDSFGRFV